MTTTRRDLSLLTTAELAFLCRRKSETVRSRLTQAGLEPVEEDGRSRRWDARRALPVLLAAEELDPRAEKARLDAARADREEIALAKQRGELEDAGEVAEAWAATLGYVTQRLRAIPSKAAPLVVTASSTAEAAQVLLDEIDEVLREISRGGRGEGGPE